MTFFEELEKLRKKPERMRRKLTIAAVLVLMTAIVAVWIKTLF